MAIHKGHVEPGKKNSMLRSKFWKALRSDKLKNSTRVYYENTYDFEQLRRVVRAEEHEIKLTIGAAQHRPVSAQDTAESSKLDLLLKKVETLEKQMEKLNTKSPWKGGQAKKQKDSGQGLN